MIETSAIENLPFQHFLFYMNQVDPNFRSCATFAEYMLSLTPGSQLIERMYSEEVDLDEVADNLLSNTTYITETPRYDPRIGKAVDLVAFYMSFNVVDPTGDNMYIFPGRYPRHFFVPDKSDSNGMIFQRPALNRNKQRIYGVKAVDNFYIGFSEHIKTNFGNYPQDVIFRCEYRTKS